MFGLLKLPETTSWEFGSATPPVKLAEPVGAVQVYRVPTGSVVTEKLKVEPEQEVIVNVCPATVCNNGSNNMSRTNLFIFPICFSIACKLLNATGIGIKDFGKNRVVFKLRVKIPKPMNTQSYQPVNISLS